MKKIEAIITPFTLDAVRKALDSVGIEGLSIARVKGYGQQPGSTQWYRSSKYVVQLVLELKVEVLVEDYKATQVVEAIRRAAWAGHVGDGKVSVLPVDEVIRIRTGERGSEAI